ncbi:MAG: PAS domain-containing hybrid sensor histidine kinase/response regulator [Acidobacteriota bacterium]
MTSASGDHGGLNGTLDVGEARLRRAQRVARLGSWELDLDTKVMWGSDEAFRIYGLELTADNSLPFEVVKHIPLAEHRPALDEALANLIRHGTPYEIRFRIRRHDDGAIRHVHSFAEASMDASGRPVLITGTIQDVTEYEEAAKALQNASRANEERARLILEQAADAIFLGTPDGVFIGVNERAVELTGYDRQELLGRDFRLLFPPRVLEVNPLRFDLVNRGDTVVNERPLTRKDGSEVVVEMRAKKLSDGTLQAIVRDISERRRLEEKLQLRQRMDSIGTLAGGIAHDFNNILTTIMGYADILRLGGAPLDPARARAVESILQAAQRAAELIRGLQALSRPDTGEAESFDVHRVAAEVFKVLAETTNRLVAKRMLVPPGRFPVHGNASALYHALMNLGINAVHAIEQKGAVSGDFIAIEARNHVAREGDTLAPGPYVHILFRDSGTGMSPEVRKRAFDPLFTTKEKGERKGQGLGLAMVYNTVVRQHRGQIDVETAPGAGTTFHLYLPRGRAAENSRDLPVEPGGAGHETVLVVDDEPSIVSLTREALQSASYSVLTAADGQQAVEVFREHAAEIDIVILDRTLPRLAGEKVLERMLLVRPDVKVVISSGDASIDLSTFPGALRLLHKPYGPSFLCAVLRDVLDTGH